MSIKFVKGESNWQLLHNILLYGDHVGDSLVAVVISAVNGDIVPGAYIR